MSLSWLASLVGVKAGTRGRVGIQRKAAPAARRQLAGQIAADTLSVQRLWLRDVSQDGRRRRTVIARVGPRGRRVVERWLAAASPADASSAPDDGSKTADARPAATAETTWLLLDHADTAVLAVVVGGEARGVLCRFNLRFSAIAERRALDTLGEAGRLVLVTGPLRWGDDGALASPHVSVPFDPAPLRAFLRNRPAAVV